MNRKCLKGWLALLILFFLTGWAFQMEAYARAGGGRSSGGSTSRGSRSTAPPAPYTAPTPKPTTPSPGVTPPRPMPTAQPSSFWRSFGGGVLGGLAGGLLFGSLFGGRSYGGGMGGMGGSGISLIDILIIGGICYLIYRYIRKRREQEAAGYQRSGGSVEMPYQAPYPPVYDQPQGQAQPAGELEQGLGYIKQYDPSFEEARFQDWCMDAFFKIQGAWANRDMSTVRALLTDEMHQILQSDVDKLKADGQINRLENIAVRSVDLTEAWQESGTDYITVRVYANLLDYTVDEAGGQVLSGSKTDPVKFEEYWTFARPVGNNPWKLSAIQQPA